VKLEQLIHLDLVYMTSNVSSVEDEDHNIPKGSQRRLLDLVEKTESKGKLEQKLGFNKIVYI
jgi:hypothetical protein